MKQIKYLEKKAFVLGLGISGRAAAEYLLSEGAHVTGVDKNVSLLEANADIQELKKKGLVAKVESDINDLSTFDLVIVSPGILPNHFLYQLAVSQNKPIWGEIELGCHSVQNPILGITGTNGKTTVTLMTTHILNACGIKARALGNVGAPLTKELLSVEPNEILVMELSSYQLDTLYQPVLDSGVILNITCDHLERYGTMDAYADSKFGMLRALKKNKTLYIEENTFDEFGSNYEEYHSLLETYGYSSSNPIYTDLKHVFKDGQKAFELPETYKGKRSHEVENLLASFALCVQFGVSPNDFIKFAQTFKKPPHRIQFVSEKQGVFYYDDSKGTNVDAVIRAVESLTGTIILIAGGVHKGGSYGPWIEKFGNKVKSICAIGQAAENISKDLSHSIPVEIFTSLDQAVQQASILAKKGDIVLLSPGCSSFDMFKDYVHRGQEFQRIVNQL